MKRKRENSGNLVHRLLRRETASAPPAAAISQSRKFFETVVPNTAIRGIQPPPGYCLSRFTPCGRFLISFDAMKNEVVLHSYRGIDLDLTETIAAGAGAAEGSNHRRQQQQNRPAVKFEDAFDLHARCSVVTGLDEQLFAFSLAVHTDYLVLASSTPDVRPMHVDGEGGAWLGVSENVTFHLLDMISGLILDRLTLRADSIHLTHLGAASLYDDMMTIVAPGQKKIYVVRIDKEQRNMRLIRTLGPRCREDDAYGSMTGMANLGQSHLGLATAVRGGAEEREGEEEENAVGGGGGEEVEMVEHHEEGGPANALDMGDRRPSEEESEEPLLLDDVPTPLLIEGLKQRLLARLYLDALDKTKNLAAEQQRKKEQQQQQINDWREPLKQPLQQRTVLPIEQFYYFFDVYLEMEMHAVLLIDSSKLLVTWMPPVNHRGTTSHLPSHIRGLHMLYDMTTTAVERVFEGGSIDFAEWCLATAPAVTGGAPANDWERFLIPGLWGQQLRRKSAQDPFSRAAMNHPGCQQQQGSPYLDQELFQFDERAVTRDLVPRPPLHRPAKFVARVWPERLRFKFEPEDVMGEAGNAARGGGGGEGENATEVVFIFHPGAPFVMAVVESTETGLAEELAFFTHNS